MDKKEAGFFETRPKFATEKRITSICPPRPRVRIQAAGAAALEEVLVRAVLRC
jgi:hypothetical protein